MSGTESKPSGASWITRAQELVYELRIREVMKKDVITIRPDAPMAELMEKLRENRVSGVPVMEDGVTVGIISIEDLIKAMASGRFEEPVASHMTRSIVSVSPEESVLQAVRVFAERGLGRLPVIGPQGALQGIITKSDITRGILNALDRHYHSEEMRRYRASHIFEDTLSDNTSLILRYHVAPRDFEEGGKASSTLKRMFERLGVDPDLMKRITISAYEAEMNLIIHTTDGGDIRVEINPERIVLITEDKGPGIRDVEEALKPGYSTAPDWVRALGFGAGMGLCNIKRYCDGITLISEPGKGTVLTAVFELKPKAEDAGGAKNPS